MKKLVLILGPAAAAIFALWTIIMWKKSSGGRIDKHLSSGPQHSSSTPLSAHAQDQAYMAKLKHMPKEFIESETHKPDNQPVEG